MNGTAGTMREIVEGNPETAEGVAKLHTCGMAAPDPFDLGDDAGANLGDEAPAKLGEMLAISEVLIAVKDSTSARIKRKLDQAYDELDYAKTCVREMERVKTALSAAGVARELADANPASAVAKLAALRDELLELAGSPDDDSA